MTKIGLLSAVAIVGLGLAIWAMWPLQVEHESNGDNLAEIILPGTLSITAEVGKSMFDVKCASCHGDNAGGREGTAPPLVHKIYEPSHHGDESFQRAVSFGVKSHHWGFGDMPPVDGLTRGDVTQIVEYIRTLQRANGIN